MEVMDEEIKTRIDFCYKENFLLPEENEE